MCECVCLGTFEVVCAVVHVQMNVCVCVFVFVTVPSMCVTHQ